MWIIWLIFSGVFFILEMFTTGFLIFWLGVASLLAMLVSFFTSNIVIQTFIFVVTSILLIFLTRPLTNKFLKVNDKNTVPTNINRIIGKEAIVIEEIKPLSNVGKIKISGEIWSAISDIHIEKDTHVKVISVDGVKLKVEPVKNTTNIT